MLQITIKTRLLSSYLQMTPNFISVLITLKMWKLCTIVLTLCCSGQKSGNLHFLLLNVKYLYSEMLNFVMCISLVAHLPNVNHNTDLGVVMDNQLTFKLHINGLVVHAIQRAALILRCFYIRYQKLLIKAFTVYVRPLLEYCCSVWSPHLMCLINCIEGVQRNYINKLKGMGNLFYDERLQILNYKFDELNLI